MGVGGEEAASNTSVNGERGEKWSVHKDEVVDMPRALTILEVN